MQPMESDEQASLEERAERIREAFRRMPGFLDTLRASQEAERTGQFTTPEELRRKYQIED